MCLPMLPSYQQFSASDILCLVTRDQVFLEVTIWNLTNGSFCWSGMTMMRIEEIYKKDTLRIKIVADFRA